MTDAPEKIWAAIDRTPKGPGEITGSWVDHGPGGPDETLFIRSDIAQAMVAAACEGCAEYAEGVGAFADEIGDNLRELTPDSARAALDALLKAEREKALREAAEVLRTMWASNNVEHEAAILDLIEKDQADG